MLGASCVVSTRERSAKQGGRAPPAAASRAPHLPRATAPPCTHRLGQDLDDVHVAVPNRSYRAHTPPVEPSNRFPLPAVAGRGHCGDCVAATAAERRGRGGAGGGGALAARPAAPRMLSLEGVCRWAPPLPRARTSAWRPRRPPWARPISCMPGGVAGGGGRTRGGGAAARRLAAAAGRDRTRWAQATASRCFQREPRRGGRCTAHRFHHRGRRAT